MSDILNLLSDPVRSRIYLEALLRDEITTKHLMDLLNISRSTLGYHLVKMVEMGILEVRTQAIGRPTKYYSLSKKAKQEQILEEIGKSDDPSADLERYAQFLEALTSHLQAIVSLSLEMSASIRILQRETPQPTLGQQMTSHFIFNVLSEEDAQTWNTKLCKFLVQLENEIRQRKKISKTKEQQTYIAFSGVLPIFRRSKR